MPPPSAAFTSWLATIEARHLADLKFAEVSRALRALSATYVERRSRLADGAALTGRGKRAAFALFYAPLHYLIVERIVGTLAGALEPVPSLIDLGCGTGAAGAAWALSLSAPPRILGIDIHPWALSEAAATYRHFGLSASTRRANAGRTELKPAAAAVVAAFTMNEISDSTRDAVLERAVRRQAGAGHVLIVEPLAGGAAPWWGRWRAAFEQAGGRADEWRFRVELPEIVARLDRAAGLDHRELTARSLWL